MFTKSMALWAISAGLASAHTWVEQMSVLADDGSYTGLPGYPRGFVPRDDPAFGDPAMVALYPPNGRAQPANLDAANRIVPADLLCKPSQDSPSKQNPQYPQLTVQPGNYIALKYLEDGHVSLPDTQAGKPGSGGLVYVYATTQSNVNPKLLDVTSWKSGSDVPLSQGRLLTVQNYDDGRCHQVVAPRNDGMRNLSPDRVAKFNNNGELPCETNVQIPTDATTGSVTLYWVWQWPSLPNQTQPDGSLTKGSIKTGKDETYTTCMDVKVVTDAGQVKAASAAEANLKGATYGGLQSKNAPIKKAVDNYKQRAANVTLPDVKSFYGPNNPDGLPRPGNAAVPPAAPSGAPGAPPATPSGSRPSGRPQKPSSPVASPTIPSIPVNGASTLTAIPSASQPAGAQAVSVVTMTVTVTATPSECIGQAPIAASSGKAARKTRTAVGNAAPTGAARVKRQHGRPFGTFQ